MRFLVKVEMLIEADNDSPTDIVVMAENEVFDYVDTLLIDAAKDRMFIAGQIKDIKRTIRKKL